MPKPAGVQRGQRDLEALPLLADQPVPVHPDAVEVDLGGGRAAHTHLVLRRRGRQAGAVAGHQQAADPARPVHAGAGHRAVEVGVPAVGDPRLGAVHHVALAVQVGPGAQRGGVGAGLRLGEAVRAELLAAQHAGQPALALRVGAEGGQRVAGQRVHADPEPDRQPVGRQLLQHLEVDLVRLPTAAVPLVVRQRQQPGLAEGAEHLAREPSDRLVLGGARLHLVAHQVPGEGEQLPGLLAGKLAVHGLGSGGGHDGTSPPRSGAGPWGFGYGTAGSARAGTGSR